MTVEGSSTTTHPKAPVMYTILMLTSFTLAVLTVIGLGVVVVPRLIYVAAHRYLRSRPRPRTTRS